MVQLKHETSKDRSSTSINLKKNQIRKKILKHPNDYIGSVKSITEKLWIWDKGEVTLQKKHFVPGLYKIFDEVLMFIVGRKDIDTSISHIWIKFQNQKTNTRITINCNDEGLSFESNENVTGIFHQLFASFDSENDDEGEEGIDYGLPLANLFSQIFTVRTKSFKNQKLYEQSWEKNITKTNKLQTENLKHVEKIDCFTEIIFEPDWKKFGMENLSDDMYLIFRQRALEISATIVKNIKVTFDEKNIPVRRFDAYGELFFGEDYAYHKTENWRVAVGLSPSQEFQHNSFVNCIKTNEGGTHVDYVADIISQGLCNMMKERDGDIDMDFELTPLEIRNSMWLFLCCTIQNATFDSPTKEFMNLDPDEFLESYNPSSKFYRDIIKNIGTTPLQLEKLKLKKRSNKKVPLSTVEARKLKITKLKIKTTKRKSVNSEDGNSPTTFEGSKSIKKSTTMKEKRSLKVRKNVDESNENFSIVEGNVSSTEQPVEIYEETSDDDENGKQKDSSSMEVLDYSVNGTRPSSVVSKSSYTEGTTNDENASPAKIPRTSYSPLSIWDSPPPLNRSKNTPLRVFGKSNWNQSEIVTTNSYFADTYESPEKEDQDDKEGQTGLVNLGNTCYMNSVVQCINHTEDLVDYFITKEFRKHINERGQTKGEFTEKIAEAIQKMNEDTVECVELREVKEILGKYYHPFDNYRQQDSHEFLTYLLHWMHEDLNQKAVNDNEQDMSISDDSESENFDVNMSVDAVAADLAWKKYLASNTSKISELFCGQQKSCVRCAQCDHISISFETFFFLSVPIPKKTSGDTLLFSDDDDILVEKVYSLEECINLYTMEERITDEVQCSGCKLKGPAYKRIEIWRLPKYLIIHLNRFYLDGTTWRKNYEKVNFPLDSLVLTPANSIENKRTYQLYGVSNHQGSMNFGHYTAYCRKDKKWTCFSDRSVTAIDSSRVCSNSGYILFYKTKTGTDNVN